MSMPADAPTPSEARDPTVQPRVPHNQWDALEVPELGTWTPTKTVTVVIPTFDDVDELPITLAALGEQTYPPDLLDVVVVDDGNVPPVDLPDRIGGVAVSTVRVDPADKTGFGAGQARATGADAAQGELLLFIDADIVCDPTHVEAHARWHHVVDYAAALGFRTFVDFAGITAEAVRDAAAGDGIAALVADREQHDHEWIEQQLAETDELRQPRADLWRVGVGSSISMPAALYHDAGGYPVFGVRGIEDVTFGYRLFTAGALLVPDRQARCWHQGPRFLADDASKKAAQHTRRPVATNNLPFRVHRPAKPGRSYVVPTLKVEVAVSEATTTEAEALACLESLLASDVADAAIGVTGSPGDPVHARLAMWMAGQERVAVTDAATWARAYPLSPARVDVDPRVRVRPDTLWRLWGHLEEYRVGAVRVAVDDLDPRSAAVSAVSTRAVNRARRFTGHPGALDGVVAELFDEQWVPAAELGVGTATPSGDRGGTGDRGAPGGAAVHQLEAKLAEAESALARLRGRKAVRLADAFGALRRARRPRELAGALRRIGLALGRSSTGGVA